MLNEFKTFLVKGNAVDMAVGFIFGAAFGVVVKSLVENIIMPPISVLLGDVDFADMQYVLKPANETSEAVSIKYGLFINDSIAFIILGFAIFLIIRALNNMQKKEEAAPAKPTEEVALLTDIRDLMKTKK